MIVRTRVVALGAIVASVPAVAGAADYFLKSRPMANDVYVYVGAAGFHDSDEDTEYLIAPLEARVLTADDWEFAIGAQLFDGKVLGMRDSAVGDVSLSAAKNFRRLGKLDFLSLELGQVLSIAPDAFSSDTDAYARVRLEAGETRARIAISVVVAEVDEKNDMYGDIRTTATIGLRSWWGQHHFGTDFIATNRHGTKQAGSVDIVYMYQRWNGDAWYVFVEKGFSDEYDGIYGGIGFEWALRL